MTSNLIANTQFDADSFYTFDKEHLDYCHVPEVKLWRKHDKIIKGCNLQPPIIADMWNLNELSDEYFNNKKKQSYVVNKRNYVKRLHRK